MKKRGRPAKPENLVKNRVVQVRLLQVEKDTFEDAAKLAGLSSASWMRSRLRDMARRELESAKKKVKFLS
jgi:hypothetical protein